MNNNDHHLIHRTKDYSIFFVKKEDKYYQVKLEDIMWITASGNYCSIHTEAQQEFVIRISLTKIKDYLLLGSFVQINKKDLINTNKIVWYDQEGSLLIQHQEFSVSRRFKKPLEDSLRFLP